MNPFENESSMRATLLTTFPIHLLFQRTRYTFPTKETCRQYKSGNRTLFSTNPRIAKVFSNQRYPDLRDFFLSIHAAHALHEKHEWSARNQLSHVPRNKPEWLSYLRLIRTANAQGTLVCCLMQNDISGTNRNSRLLVLTSCHLVDQLNEIFSFL